MTEKIDNDLIPRSRNEIRAEYEDMADGYDRGSADCGWQAPNILVASLERTGAIRPGMKICDFATGTGDLSRAFRNTRAGGTLHITATDLSPAMLTKAGAKNVADALFEQDITKPWAVGADSQDIVAGTGVAEYLTDADLADAVHQAARSLKSGGKLAFTFLPAAEGAPASRPDQQQAHGVSFVEAVYRQNDLRLQTTEAFDAYRADDGTMVRHVLAVGLKP